MSQDRWLVGWLSRWSVCRTAAAAIYRLSSDARHDAKLAEPTSQQIAPTSDAPIDRRTNRLTSRKTRARM